MSFAPRAFLEGLCRTAIAAAHPATCLSDHLPLAPGEGRLIILAAGKAAGSMTEIAERHYLESERLPETRLAGLAVTKRGRFGLRAHHPLLPETLRPLQGSI